LLPFFSIYYAITRRTETALIYKICGTFIIGFVSVIVNTNIDEESVESLGSIRALTGSPLIVKKGIDQSCIFAKNKLNS